MDVNTLPNLLEWLQKAAKATPYGEVAIRLYLHDGRIVRIGRTTETTEKAGGT